MHRSNTYKIALVCSIIMLAIGLLLMGKEVKTYSTSEYWVAKNYHHVYEQRSGKIVDYIEDSETCKIKNDEIIVTKRKAGIVGNAFGIIITFTSSCIIIGLIIYALPNNEK